MLPKNVPGINCCKQFLTGQFQWLLVTPLVCRYDKQNEVVYSKDTLCKMMARFLVIY